MMRASTFLQRFPLLLLAAMLLALAVFLVHDARPASAERHPTLDGVSLSIGGNAVTLTEAGTNSWVAHVPFDTTSVSVTPTWSTPTTTGKVRSTDELQETVFTPYTTVASGGSVDVTLNPSEHWYRDDTVVGILLERTQDASFRNGGTILIKRSGEITATLSANPSTVREGEADQAGTRANVTITLSQRAPRDILIPVSITNETAEDGDWHIPVKSVMIRRGETSGHVMLRATEDEDADDETLLVVMGTPPSDLTPGLTVFTVTIDDNDDANDPAQETLPLVSFTAAPARVDEGQSFTVTATLSKAASVEVRIPWGITRSTAEYEDIAGLGSLEDFVIPAGGTSAGMTLQTRLDADTEDEEFEVDTTLDALPLELGLGRPSGATVTIADNGVARPTGLAATEGDGRLDLAWTAPPGTVTGYDVHYTSLLSGRWDAPLSSGSDPAAGWVDGGHTGTTATHALTGLVNDRYYRVRVRAKTASGASGWAGVTGTPEAPPPPVWTATLTVQQLTVEGLINDGFGCSVFETGKECSSTSILTDDDFSLGGTDYSLQRVHDVPDNSFVVDMTLPTSGVGDDLKALKFCVGSRAFALSGLSDTQNRVSFPNTDVGWSVGDTVQLSIASTCPATGSGVGGSSAPHCDNCGTGGDTGAVSQGQDKYAGLIARMKEWRNDPEWVSEKAHTDRWDRALLAFGETVADTTLSPMTAAEAQGFADRGWERWVEVAAALRELQNRAPTVSSGIADVTIVSDSGSHAVSLAGVFDDPDGDSLTMSVMSSDEATATASVSSDGSTLTVTARLRGAATITVTAADGNGGAVEDSFTVTVKAAPLVASALDDVSGLEAGSTRDVSLTGVFSDADGDAVTISAASSDDTIATVSVAADGSTLTLAGVAEGTATVTVTAEDSDGNRVSDDFQVEVVKRFASLISQMYQWRNDPQWSSEKAHTDRWDRALLAFGETVADATLTPMTAAEAQGFADRGWERWVEVAVALRVLQNRAPTVSAAIADATIVSDSGTSQVSLSGVFDDPDGDSLTMSAASSDEGKATVSVSSGGSSLTVNAQARGTATITVTASDGNGGKVSDDFTVTVKAAPLVASAVADMSLKAGATQEEGGAQDVSLASVFSDADGDSLTFSAETSDFEVAEVLLLQGTLTVLAVAGGSATITVTAQDSDGNTVSDTFDVSVEGPPAPVTNLSCVAQTGQALFRWDVPDWSGADVYAYDYDLTRPDGEREQARLQGYPLVRAKGEYQAGQEASISVKAVYELADGSQVSSAAATLACTVAE